MILRLKLSTHLGCIKNRKLRQIASLLVPLLLSVLWQPVIAQTDLKPCIVSEQDSVDDSDSLGGAEDIDEDGDGLIEVCYLEDLDAIRYQLDGTGYRATRETTTTITRGCPATGCIGYELIRDLDFKSNDSYRYPQINREAWTVSDNTDVLDKGWLALGGDSGFSSIFKANGYAISNLTINRTTTNDVSLFGSILPSARIDGLRLLNVDIKGGNQVGSLVGYSKGNITNSYASGNIEGNNRVGGLIGWFDSGSITNSSATVSVTGNSMVGGLAGGNWHPGSIANSHARGEVVGRGNEIGGLIGSSGGVIINSHARGDVRGQGNRVGGLVGYSTHIITKSYARGDVEAEKGNFVGGLVGYKWSHTTASHAVGNVKGNNYVGGLVGGWEEGGNFGTHFENNYYAAGRVEGNDYVGGLVGRGRTDIIDSHAIDCVVVGNNSVGGLAGDFADYNDIIIYTRYSYSECDVAGNNYVGGLVGTSNNRIENSHARGKVVGTGSDIGGLVGIMSGRVRHSYAESSVKGTSYVGGLTGWNGGNTEDSYAIADVEGITAVGGLTGFLQIRKTIRRSYALGTVVGTGSDIGGLVGISEGTIRNSYADVNVTGDMNVGGLTGQNGSHITNSHALGTVDGNDNIGGLVGIVRFGGGHITNSYASGNIEGNNNIGGLVGYISGHLEGLIDIIGQATSDTTNTYARGNVNGNQYVGGLVGYIKDGAGNIRNSYASGSVQGNIDVGGLIGKHLDNASGATTVTNSYWDITASGIISSDRGKGFSTTDLQTATRPGGSRNEPYYQWHGSDWGFGTAKQYPILRYAVGPELEPACGSRIDLPRCGTLLPGQLQPVRLMQLVLSDGSTLSPNFKPTVHSYHVAARSDATHLRLKLITSDIDNRISVRTDGGFINEMASSNTRVLLNSNDATVITIKVTAAFSLSTEYKLYVNRSPAIVSEGLTTAITIKEGREQTINVKVSDADTNDLLTLLLSATNPGQDFVELVTANIAVSTNNQVVRDAQQLRIKGIKAGEIQLSLAVQDMNTTSEVVLLSVKIEQNNPPTIAPLSDLRLLTETETGLNAILSDADADDANNLKASVRSGDDAIATASIAEDGGAVRTLNIRSGSSTGTATITVTVDDGRKTTNSISTETFIIAVEANQAPTIKLPADQIIQWKSTANVVVAVADDNFDVYDRVSLTASTSSIVSIEPARIDGISNSTATIFTLTGVRAGTAEIEFTATDSKGAITSKTISVLVNTPPRATTRSIATKVATIGKKFILKTSEFFEDADGDKLKYEAVGLPNSIGLTATGTLIGIPILAEASKDENGQTVTITVSDRRGGNAQTIFLLLIDAETTGTVSIESDTLWQLQAVSRVSDENGISEINYQWYKQAVGTSGTILIPGASDALYRMADEPSERAAGTLYEVSAEILDKIGRTTILSAQYTVMNKVPTIVSEGLTTAITIKEGREQTINVKVSDADTNDLLTLLLSATNPGQDFVELVTANIAVSTNNQVVRDAQQLRIKGIKAGEIQLSLAVQDMNTTSEVVLLSVKIEQNNPPTIAPLSDLRLLTETETGLNAILSDADADDANNLKASVRSGDDAIATASIAKDGGAVRTLNIRSGSSTGTATITVTVDDDRKTTNSISTETFIIAVEANQAPTIKLPADQIIQWKSTASVVVAVADDNFDVYDRVSLTASTSSIVSIEPARIDGISNSTATIFTLTGVRAGTAEIEFTATDSKGAITSETISVLVNTPPRATRSIATKVATIGKKFILKTSEFFEDADGDKLKYEAVGLPNSIGLTATGTLIGIPILAEASKDENGQTVTITVSDGSGGNAQTTFLLLIDAETTGTVSIESDTPWQLQAIAGVGDENGISEINYQWYKQAAGTSGTILIPGASDTLYKIADEPSERAAGTLYEVSAEILDEIGRTTILSARYTVMNKVPIIRPIAPMPVKEGHTIDANKVVSDANRDDLSYTWQAIDESNEEKIIPADSSLFVVPADLVKSPAMQTTMTLQLAVFDGIDDVTTKVSVVVLRINNGAARSKLLIRDQQTLMLPTVDLSNDPDGGGTTAAYTWERCLNKCIKDDHWKVVVPKTSTPTSYILQSTDEGYRFRVRVHYRDGQDYPENIFYTNAFLIRAKVFLEGPLQ